MPKQRASVATSQQIRQKARRAEDFFDVEVRCSRLVGTVIVLRSPKAKIGRIGRGVPADDATKVLWPQKEMNIRTMRG